MKDATRTEPHRREEPPAPSLRGPLASIVVLVVAAIAAGIVYHRDEARQLREEAQRQVEAVARLKADQIDAWRTERLTDAALLSESPAVPEDVASFLAAATPASRAKLLTRFRSLTRLIGYDDAFLVDVHGNVRLTLKGTEPRLHPDARAAIEAALGTRHAVLTDLHAGPGDLPRHVDVVAPVFGGDTGAPEPIGAIVLRSEADRSLDPMIASWPVPSRTAETLLVRRDGDSVLFLNNLRHRQRTALRLRIPLSRVDLPAAQVVTGQRGVVEGRDYRGVPVLAAVHAIPNSPWFVVAKVDTAELLAPLHVRSLLSAGLLALLVLVAVVGSLAVWQRSSKGHYKRLYLAERARIESEARYRSLFEHMAEGLAHCRMVFENGQPRDFVYLEVNPAFERLTGLSGATGRAVTEIIPGIRETNPELFEIYGRVAATGGAETFETYVPPLDIWFHVSAFGLEKDEFVAVFSNITERKHAEEALRESEDRFRYVFEGSPLGKSITLPTGEVSVNQAFCDMLGYSREELAHRTWQELSHPDDVPATREHVEAMLAGEKDSARFTKRYLRKDGAVVWADAATTLRRDAGGRPLYFMTVVSDVTERVRAEVERARLAQQRRLALDAAQLGWWHYDPISRVATYDERYQEIFGVTGTARPNEEILKLLHPDDLPRVWAAVEAALDPARRRPYVSEYRVNRSDGSLRWVEAHGVATFEGEGDLRRATSLVGTVQDITARKRAESRLRALTARQDAMLAAIPDIIMEVDTGGVFTWANRAGMEFFGENVLGHAAAHYAAAEQRSDASLEALLTGALDGAHVESWQRRHDGQARLLAWSWRALRDEQGTLIGALSSARDVTEARLAEERLRSSEQRLRRFYESGLIGVMYWNTDGEIVDANDRFLEMVGYTREELRDGRIDWTRMTPPEFRRRDEESLAELTATGVNRIPFEKEYIRKDGTRVPILVAGAMLDERRLDGVAFVLDITERKQAQEEVLRLNQELEQRVRDRTAQLEASNKELESFAYSVSHDLRAPLRGIDGWSMALLEDCSERLDAQGRQYLDRVRAEAQRMGALIDDLLALSRVTRAELSAAPIDISALAQNIVDRLREEHPDRNVETVVQPGLAAWGDEALIEVALANLIENAWKFSAARDPARIEVGRAQSDGVASFFVRDNGAGFDMAHAKKLFGAFQRLHRVSEFPGTGVGLATVHRIVARHGGRTWAEAQVDQGATFYFTLAESL